jgi:hypothetical protein
MKKTNLNIFKKDIDLYNRSKKQLTKKVKDNLEKVLLDIIKACPELTNVSWVGYVPSFNDGDPCEFGFNSSPYRINDEYEDSPEPKLKPTVDKLINIISQIPESVLRDCYGDNFELTLTQNKLSHEYYDCGY